MFDPQGNLWIATDGAPEILGMHDGFFATPVEGTRRGHLKAFLTVPVGAEASGPAQPGSVRRAASRGSGPPIAGSVSNRCAAPVAARMRWWGLSPGTRNNGAPSRSVETLTGLPKDAWPGPNEVSHPISAESASHRACLTASAACSECRPVLTASPSACAHPRAERPTSHSERGGWVQRGQAGRR